MLFQVRGDLLSTSDKFIIHGCNAQGKMNSGVAKVIRERWPKAWEDYSKAELKLGRIISSSQPDSKIIINAITQEFYGNDGKKYASYDAIDEAMSRLDQSLKLKTHLEPYRMEEQVRISMPKIGCGLGGCEWAVVEAIVAHRLKDHIVTVWTL